MIESHTWIPLREFPTKELHPEGPWQEGPSDGVSCTYGNWVTFLLTDGTATSCPPAKTQPPWVNAQPPTILCDHPKHKALVAGNGSFSQSSACSQLLTKLHWLPHSSCRFQGNRIKTPSGQIPITQSARSKTTPHNARSEGSKWLGDSPSPPEKNPRWEKVTAPV